MSMSQEEIEALMSGADDVEVDGLEETAEDVVSEDSSVSESEDVNVEDLLAGIDGIVDDGSTEEKTDKSIEVEEREAKINNGEYPLPVSNENKVVNQLNEVADDSEEKASQIFDILSFILDENEDIENYNKEISSFILKQTELLESLSSKFPNVGVFTESLENASNLIEVSKELSSKIDAENNRIFEAMELMQYHDINRQKIERVMAVIKKLSIYLNGIFEDDSGKAEVQIAKHISGDSAEIVDADDIESLISEFSKE
ncbi:MAG: hypothetical protein CSA86_03080 [Arcobacter sp.]|nr:MAG: hypothetical protein CSA86_03080 [Arcobacter sp.]